MKTCKDCGNPTGSITSHRQRCVVCIDIHRKHTKKVSKEKYNYHQRPSYRFQTYKRGAKNRGYEFDITYEQFEELLQKPCKYCNDKIKDVGLDRIDNKKGYTIDNINTCCSTCNFMKGKLTELEFINKCKQISSVFTVDNVDSDRMNTSV